jgi:hypothetical protein
VHGALDSEPLHQEIDRINNDAALVFKIGYPLTQL